MTGVRWGFYTAVVSLVLGAVLLAGLRIRGRSEDPVTIRWNTVHQTIDGFGASATGYVEGFTEQQADRLFNSDTGLGLSLLRLNLIPDTVKDDCECVSNNPRYQCAVGTKSQILTGDLQVAKSAMSRGVHIFASPWSPPAEMKTSGKFCSGGAIKGNPDNYAKYADRLASFPQLLKENGIALDAISVQNEPDVEKEYETCRWSGQQIHDFIPYLAEKLHGAGLNKIKIAIPEESEWTFGLLNESIDDPAVARNAALVFGHGYSGPQPSGLPNSGGRHVWQTEVGDSRKFDGTISDGLKWAQSLHNFMTVGASAWMYWNLDCGEAFFNEPNNMCLTDHESHLAKRAYVLGQYAKFVRPGWQRIGITNRGSLLITAYKNAEGRFAIVAINSGTWPIHNQQFLLDGVAYHHSQIVPWITSASASLEKQEEITSGADGAAFTYTVPASSVVTFTGQVD
jgi:glucuronoarabinoxylan endo-1,4-beta-xylanase